MSPLIYEPESTTQTESQQWIIISSQTIKPPTICQILPWSVKGFLTLHVIKSVLIKLPLSTITHLKTAVSTKISNSHHGLLKEENAAETFYGLIRRLAPKWRPTLEIFGGGFLDKHSSKNHKYYKLFSRNNVKISYSCRQNIGSVIQNHNTNLLKHPVASTAKECSFRQNSDCPLAAKCLSECLVYHAQVKRSDIDQTKS